MWIVPILVTISLSASTIDATFDCLSAKDHTNCSCSRSIDGGYELWCPPYTFQNSVHIQPEIMAKITPNKFVNLQCTSYKSPTDLTLMSGLNIGPVREFAMKLCPFPSISFKEYMLSMGIPQVQTIQVNFAGNLTSIQSKHLEGLNEVSSLDLSTNGLVTLPEDLFKDMSNLSSLHLKNNNVELPKGIFKYVPKLEILELGNNNLTYLEPGIFRNLTHLRLLNLWNNKLTNLTRAVFTDTPDLESLDLNSNSLVTLRPDLFTDIRKLKNINLYSNEFVSLPQGLFSGNPLIERFQLYNNKKTLRLIPPGLLANLTHLREVNMFICNITSLPQDLLWGSPAITNITFNRNLLTELPVELFRDSREMLSIDISYNSIAVLEDGIFSATEKLRVLNAHHNQLTSISERLLSTLEQLDYLDLSYNKLTTVSQDAFISNKLLKTISVSHNFLILEDQNEYSHPIQSPFRYCINLQELYLVNNSIHTIYDDWKYLMQNLKALDLQHNKITHLTTSDLRFLSKALLTVDLSYNSIKTVDLKQAESIVAASYNNSTTSFQENRSAKIRLAGNPLQCDCGIYDFKQYFEGKLTPEVNYFFTIEQDGLSCASPEELSGVPISEVSSTTLTCEWANEQNSTDNCVQKYRPYDLAVIVDCSSRNYTTIPEKVLPDIKQYDWGRNSPTHIELNLTGNHIREMPRILDDEFKYVTKLYISNNNLTRINISALTTEIAVLELDNNNLTSILPHDVHFLKHANKLKYITLYDNPWICDCRVKGLLNFIYSDYTKVSLRRNITCTNGKAMELMTVSEICPENSTKMVVFSILIAVVGLALGIMIALYYRYQQEIKVWLYAHQMCLWFVTEEELDKDKAYDAFISYSHKDEDFVVKHLVPGLENGPQQFKLCLHYRDWIVGDWIPNQIARSVEDSRRTIVVLSPNFLESVWGRMEFKTAHKQALNEGRARVIMLLYGDIGPIENLDEELRAYISMNTYIKWGDTRFWEKLRYALPHPANLKTGLPLVPRAQVRQTVLNIERADLMNGTDPNSTPPATTTPPANSFLNEIPSLIPNGKPKSIDTMNESAKIPC